MNILPSDTLAILSVQARRGQSEQLAAQVRSQFNLQLSDAPRREAGAGMAFLGVSPGGWLVTSSHGREELAVQLRGALGETASVTDVSAAYVLMRLAGPRVRNTLAKLLPLDLHPRIFAVGCVARTLAGHGAVLLWRLPDAEGSSVFELAAPRSSAASLCQAVASSAAEFGLAVEAAAPPHWAALFAHGHGAPNA